ncbi:HtaA domain-containing protein [Actinophytocola oryzae]|uniref:Htaa protein n=1 Tax=Actinophytocola oryzae TaxID=502181 RepID=A0A4R7USC7_9PSEU|nr:HtaA domain-containing protein [Actinophytocola oryzae]TDV38673.1 Htaa protein [Actinophytocola oryzae]
MSTRTTKARPLAAGLVVALGLLAGPLVGTAQAATVSGGQLDWGVKQSFRSYIGGPIAHGTITASDGATKNADGTFRFPSATGSVDADANSAELAFTGKVEFTGHDSGSGPLLYMTIEDIRVTLTASGGTLVADVVSKSLSSGQLTTYDDVEFATLSAADLTGTDTVTGTNVAATLTEAGAPAFADFYPAGTALDPLSFAVTAAPDPVWEPAVTVSKTSGLDPTGETITVTGNGFDPAANVGTRPPLAGQRTGVYVVFAKIAQPWKPSEGAPSAARTVLDQKWVLPAASRAILDPTGTNPDFAELTSEGTFSTTLDLTAVTDGVADCTVDTCGVITYAAGGAVNAAHEFFTPLSFSTTDPTDPTDPTTTPEQPAGVTNARLDWGLKQSFRNYVRGPIAHGSWTLDGVTGEFRWETVTSAEYEAGTGGQVAFSGGVRFTGHDGQLDLTISQPQVRFADGSAELVLDVRSKSLETGEFTELDDVVFATLGTAAPTVADGVVTYTALPAKLTAEGAAGFAGFYDAGADLDPVTVTIALDGATLPPGGGTDTGDNTSTTPASASGLAETGSPIAPLVALGALLLVGGAGLLRARRRASV